MDAFLDYLVSTSWLAVTVYIFLLLAIVGIWFFRPFRKMVFNRVMHVIVSLGGFAFMMYMQMGPSGYAVQFIQALSNGREVCLVEEHWQSDDTGGYEVWRLYVLDFATGKRIYRMNLESPELLYVSDSGVVFFERSVAVEYDLTEGKKTREWSTETGFERFPELRVGLKDLNRQSEAYRGENSAYLALTALDGHKYCYVLETDQLLEAGHLNQVDTTSLQYNDYGVSYYGPGRSEKYAFRFRDKTGEIDELYYADRSGAEKRFDGEFLMPQVVSLNKEEQYFVVKHFTTLEQDNAVLTAINFDLSVKWRVEQFELKVTDSHSDKPRMGPCITVDDDLVVTYGGFVVRLDGATGDVVWKVRQ